MKRNPPSLCTHRMKGEETPVHSVYKGISSLCFYCIASCSAKTGAAAGRRRAGRAAAGTPRLPQRSAAARVPIVSAAAKNAAAKSRSAAVRRPAAVRVTVMAVRVTVMAAIAV